MQNPSSIEDILDSIKDVMSKPVGEGKNVPLELTEVVEESSSKSYNTIFEEEVRSILKELLRPYLKSWIKNNIEMISRDIIKEEIINSKKSI